MSTIKKNTITIFLASSDELINDRNSFQALISSLDDIYELRGIRVKCKRWEDFVAYCTGERTQDDYNKVLSNSDICICMFHRKAGMYTIEEFNHAMDEYKRTKDHPKTYVYARAVVDGEIEDEALKQFKADLFKQMGHYWCNYTTDDSMKLHFIMQFERILNAEIDSLRQDEGNIKVENGAVLLHGRKVADYANLPFASANKELNLLKQQITDLEKEIATLSALGIDALLPTINEKKSKRCDLSDQVKQLEEQLLNMAISISKMITSGEPISERKRLAIEMFEQGNTEGVLNVLNEDDIANDIEEANRRREHSLRLAQLHQEEAEFQTRKIRSTIEEYILKADNWMSTYTDPDRLSKACALYEKAIESTRKYLPEEDLAEQLFNYAKFLHDNNQYNKVEPYYQECLNIYSQLSEKDFFYNEDVALILDRLALLHRERRQFSEAETLYKESIELKKNLFEPNTILYKYSIAKSLLGLAGLYHDLRCFGEAEELYKEVLDIYSCLSDVDEIYRYNLAGVLCDFANLYLEKEQYHDAEIFYKESLSIYRLLEDESGIALLLNNLAVLYTDIQNYEEAGVCCRESLSIYRNLAEKNPERYEPSVANTLLTFARICRHIQQNAKAEQLCKESLEILFRLCKINSEIYEFEMSKAFNELASICIYMGRFLEAEQFISDSIKFADGYPIPYTTLATIFLLQGRFEEAKDIYLKYKDELKDSFLSDFEEFKANNIIPKERLEDVEKIIELLK